MFRSTGRGKRILLTAATSLMMALSGPGNAWAGVISDLTLKIKTTNDNREGGILEVTLWQDDRPIAKYEDTEKSWADNEEVKINAENPLKTRAFQPGVPIEARVKLRDGKEYNISWNFNIEVV